MSLRSRSKEDTKMDTYYVVTASKSFLPKSARCALSLVKIAFFDLGVKHALGGRRVSNRTSTSVDPVLSKETLRFLPRRPCGVATRLFPSIDAL